MNPRDLLFAISMLLVMIGMARTGLAFGDDRVQPICFESEADPSGEGLMSTILGNATLSHWEFRRDGSVAASRAG